MAKYVYFLIKLSGRNIECSQAADELDDAGWSALHHAVDATSYCERAVDATWHLITKTPARILNSGTTGSRPNGYTCLHFACDGSDRSYCRADVVRELVQRKADLEKVTDKGSTPFLLARGTGVTDIVNAMVESGADVYAKNDRQVGGYQSAQHSSSETRQALESHGVVKPKTKGPSARQYHGVSESRRTRHLQRDCEQR